MEYGWRPKEPGPIPEDPRDLCPEGWRAVLPSGEITALCFGSEFCQEALPTPEGAQRWVGWAGDLGLEPVLLTPPVTSRGLARLGALLEGLSGRCPGLQVVCNDWGTLRAVGERFPRFRVRAGRLLNRGLRDPRPGAQTGREAGDRAGRLRRLLAGLGAEAVETDVDLAGGFLGDGSEGLERTLHLPFSFVASGRNCLVRLAEGGEAPDDWTTGRPCTTPCRRGPKRVVRQDTPVPLWRAGNTLFREAPLGEALRDLARADRVVLHEEPLP
ncbi:hypothetical protein [Deferrisoma camini]|uniref:hypothetical protein n=1 Tax=Deferrisoma camini TaxID=1035120 RepID=UPI0004B26385|nr:hypothetical protein [Deferrisoma camini]